MSTEAAHAGSQLAPLLALPRDVQGKVIAELLAAEPGTLNGPKALLSLRCTCRAAVNYGEGGKTSRVSLQVALLQAKIIRLVDEQLQVASLLAGVYASVKQALAQWEQVPALSRPAFVFDHRASL